MPAGRPTSFTQELADIICERIADGESLRTVCDDEGFPNKSTVFRWLADPEHKDFATKYAYAREAQADLFVDEMVDIADDGRNDWMEKRDDEGGNLGWKENGEALRRSDIRIKTRQWIAEKMKPKKYGSKVQAEVSGEVDVNHKVSNDVERFTRAIAGLVARSGTNEPAE